ncbi:unnamed protein product, partial [Allacma fusca]
QAEALCSKVYLKTGDLLSNFGASSRLHHGTLDERSGTSRSTATWKPSTTSGHLTLVYERLSAHMATQHNNVIIRLNHHILWNVHILFTRKTKLNASVALI